MEAKSVRTLAVTVMTGAVLLMAGCAPAPWEGSPVVAAGQGLGAVADRDQASFNAAFDNLRTNLEALQSSDEANASSAIADASDAVDEYAAAVAGTTFPATPTDGLPSQWAAQRSVTASQQFIAALESAYSFSRRCPASMAGDAACTSEAQRIQSQISSTDSAMVTALNQVINERNG